MPLRSCHCDGVVRHFGRFAALRGITAEFSAPAGDPAAGKLFLILGENGAGKSTLLRIMAGLLKPSRGSVSLLGTTELREVASRVGYMGHAPLLYDELSAMENLRYFAALYGIDDHRNRDALAAHARGALSGRRFAWWGSIRS